ncbi:SMP-30/gluconolactonase/LRE family protein [Reinekea sp.]|jgi:D-xylonolactonase|uniref:SMP-30/gluconolactonase/LRE family protein n=1 Tax=Reinekea sp. TaxID=1970455 RepID=UPI003988E2BF
MNRITTHRQYRNIIGESPIADEDFIYWVDAEASQVFQFALLSQTVQCFDVGIPVTAIAFTSENSFLLASKTGIYLSSSDFTELQFICDPVSEINDARINDAVVSPKGELWFGTMNEASLEQPDGAIYIMKGQLGSLVQFDTGFSVSNGIAFSPDGKKVYIANMFQAQVLEYQLSDSGEGYISKRVFIQLDENDGLPDGLKTDSLGNLYLCHWAGRCLTVYNSTGERIERVDFPAFHVTRATFYGGDLTKLVVTSGSYQCDDQCLVENPDSGHLFLVNATEPGLPEHRYHL